MYVDQENVCYYLTVGNEPYSMPAMPADVEEGILKGAYLLRRSNGRDKGTAVKLLGSGAILNEVLEAHRILEQDYGIDSEVWSVTSYQQLFRDGLEVARWNRLHPDEEPRTAYVSRCFGRDDDGLVVAASDYVKALPYSIRSWVNGAFVGLGTDGFGRSDGRAALRDYFEVDARHVVYATLESLAREKRIERKVFDEARAKLSIDPDKPDPLDF